jgi:hypothetical protein
MRQHHTTWGLATPVAWEEDGLEQRLNLYFSADDLDWWISEVRTRDGFKNADWITYQTDFLAATPRGDTYEGDLELIGGDGRVPGSLVIKDMRLTAFAPGTGPVAQIECEPVRASLRRGAQPLDAGQPLAGSGLVEGMTPTAAEDILQASGLCYTFRYSYSFEEQGADGYTEVWCTAPPEGALVTCSTRMRVNSWPW